MANADTTERLDLLQAAQISLFIAESWINDQLGGTPLLAGALEGLKPVRAAIQRAAQAS